MTDREKDPGGFFRFVSAQQVLGIYRACQDARGAVRSIIKSQRNPTDTDIHPGRYRIDTNKIFIGGMSAGSLMAMNTVYYQRHSQIDSSLPGVSTVLGDIDQDYYYGDTTINFLPNILGVLDMWGAIILHKNLSNQSSFFGGLQYHPPIIGFQGQGDIIFPPDRDFVYFSPPRSVSYDFLNRNLNTETHCLNTSSYSVDTFELNHDAIAIGIDRIWNMPWLVCGDLLRL